MAMCENEGQSNCANGTRLPSQGPNVDQDFDDASVIIDDSTYAIFRTVNFSALSGIIAVFGSFANIINVIVLVKLGFRKTVNMGLLGIALSDLGALVFLVWHALCYNPAFAQSPLVPFAPYEVHVLSAAWPNIVFIRISGCYTTFVTFERCLCVALPLKVKVLVTHNRVIAILVTIAILVVVSFSPMLSAMRLEWQFYPSYNKTLLGIAFADNYVSISSIMYLLNDCIMPWTYFTATSICTAVLVIQMKSKIQWRKTAASSNLKSEDLSARDRKIVRMIITISSIFIIASTPGTVTSIAAYFIHDFGPYERYHNFFETAISFAMLLESLNCSVNIFVFYNMNTEFRNLFKNTFCGTKK